MVPETVSVVSLVMKSLDDVPLSVAIAVIATVAVGAAASTVTETRRRVGAGIARDVGQPGRHVERALALRRERRQRHRHRRAVAGMSPASSV